MSRRAIRIWCSVAACLIASVTATTAANAGTVIVQNNTTFKLSRISTESARGAAFEQLTTEVGRGEQAAVIEFDETALGVGAFEFRVKLHIDEQMSPGVRNYLGEMTLIQRFVNSVTRAAPRFEMLLELPGEPAVPLPPNVVS